MNKKEYTTEELIELLESKVINGKVSLNDIAEIVFDAKFPERLSETAVANLIKYSNDYKRYKELAELLSSQNKQILNYQEEINALFDKEDRDEKEENETIEQIYTLKNKQKEIEDLIKALEDEFNNLHEYFQKIQEP